MVSVVPARLTSRYTVDLPNPSWRAAVVGDSPAAGFVRLTAGGWLGWLPSWASGGGHKHGNFAPGLESTVSGRAMLIGSLAVTTELEVIVDPAVGGQEALGMAR